MSNNQSDFAPEHRALGIYSGDARRIVQGRATDVYLTKIGERVPDDISGLEPVQWGLRLQEPIGRAVGDRLNVRLKELDVEVTHIKHPWMKSHFDFVSEDNKTLYEIKNYGSHARNKFGDDGSQDIPLGDMAQLIHEAAVFNITSINLCVLFGGQELCIYPFEIDDALKESLILQEAAVWAAVQTRQPPTPTHPDDIKALWKRDDGTTLVVNENIAAACAKLRQVKDNIKELETAEESLVGAIQQIMADHAVIKDFEGKILATWKTAKGSARFDSKRFKEEMPETYEKFVISTDGSRRFLVK